MLLTIDRSLSVSVSLPSVQPFSNTTPTRSGLDAHDAVSMRTSGPATAITGRLWNWSRIAREHVGILSVSPMRREGQKRAAG